MAFFILFGCYTIRFQSFKYTANWLLDSGLINYITSLTRDTTCYCMLPHVTAHVTVKHLHFPIDFHMLPHVTALLIKI